MLVTRHASCLRERRPAATVGMETDKFWLIDIWLSFTAIQKVPSPFIGELYLHLNSLLILTSSLCTGGFEFSCMIFLVKLSLLAPDSNSLKLINPMPNRSWLPYKILKGKSGGIKSANSLLGQSAPFHPLSIYSFIIGCKYVNRSLLCISLGIY